MKRIALRRALFAVLQTGLLALALGLWWTYKNNTLFGNGRWVIGKDAGKFVFYTYDFMFGPLEESRVDLSQGMGFQEILYGKAEGPDRELAGLRFEALVSNDAYLWVVARQEGQRQLGFRLSRNDHFPGGYFRHDERGELIEHAPADGEPFSEPGWCEVELSRSNATWRISVNNRPLMTATNESLPGGRFGFRGSGTPRSRVMVKNIHIFFRDPAQPNRIWVEREKFKPSIRRLRLWEGTLLVAAGVVLLYGIRTRRLASWVPAEQRATFYLATDLSLTILLLLAAGLPKGATGWPIPCSFIALEIAHLITFHRMRKKHNAEPQRPGWPGVLTYGVLLSILGAAAFGQVGEWLGRSGRNTRASLDDVNPRAFLVKPDRNAGTQPFDLASPALLVPGEPLFVEGHAFQEQKISADFTISTHCTLDVVYQLQSYLTRGDPDGEALPLQRRLIRLTTRPDVPSGFSTRTGNRPAPFEALRGLVQPDRTNRLEILAGSASTTVILNGVTNIYRGYPPLGWGETGFMVFEESVTLTSLRVEPLSAGARVAGAHPLVGAALPWLFAALVWLALRPGGSTAVGPTVLLAQAALCPISLYLVGALVCGADQFSFLEKERRIWLDLLMIAASFSLLHALVAFRGSLRFQAFYFNLIALAVIGFAGLLTWDVLPPDHPLRLKFTDQAVAPGGLVEGNRGNTGPWYSVNRSIGASTFVWKQHFSHERITLRKSPGTLRAFVVGGSQAWGSGAADSKSTFTELLERRLRAKGLPVDLFNAGVNGAGISKVNELHRDLLSSFQPDLIIADIGLNDSAGLRMVRKEAARAVHRDLLLADFEALVRRCREQETDVILSLETMCRETPLRPIREYYDGLVRIAAQHGVTVVDPAADIREKEANHFVWWDTAHFAPYGHALLADLLEPAAEDVLRRRLAERPSR